VLHEDEDGGDLVGEHVGVAGGRQVLAGQGHDVEARRQLVEEARVAWGINFMVTIFGDFHQFSALKLGNFLEKPNVVIIYFPGMFLYWVC
jgi:hypothetical protein